MLHTLVLKKLVVFICVKIICFEHETELKCKHLLSTNSCYKSMFSEESSPIIDRNLAMPSKFHKGVNSMTASQDSSFVA